MMREGYRAPELLVFADAAEVASALADALAERARRAPGSAVLLAGGTTPAAAYALCGQRRVNALDLWFTDERMVPPDHADSNYRMIERAWLTPAGVAAEHVHRIAGELGAERAAALASRAWQQRAPAPYLAVLGLGTDGHTASLFPGDPACHATGAFVPAQSGKRVTATGALLSSAEAAWFVVTGAGKAGRLAELVRNRRPPPESHARTLVTCEHVKVFCDAAAAIEVNVTATSGH